MTADHRTSNHGVDDARADRPGVAPRYRSVALPSEHGGWGLTLEPGLLGWIIAPSAAGACLVSAAMVAFLVRTPLKLVLVDRRRGRTLPRTVLARRVVAVELVTLGGLSWAAWALARPGFWIPLIVAVPLAGVEGWFDVRSRGRRLVPECAGAVAVGAVAPMIVLADGRPVRLAAAAWMVIAARVVTSIPHVRTQVARIHSRSVGAAAAVGGDVAALALAAGATVVDHRLAAGAVAVAVLVVAQRVLAAGPAPRAVVVGMRQTILGVAVAVAAAFGV